MDEDLYGAAKFTNMVYNEFGGEENYSNNLKKEGFIKGVIIETGILILLALLSKFIPFFKRKYQELIEKRKKKKLKQKNTETEDKDANTMPGMRITGKH